MEVNCSLFQEMIFPYLDNNLTDEATACFLEHAGSCPQCQAALEEARAFEFGLIGVFSDMEPPVDLADNIMGSLHADTTLFPEAATEPVIADVAAVAATVEESVEKAPAETEQKAENQTATTGGKVTKFPKKGIVATVGTLAAAAVLALAIGVSGMADNNEVIDFGVADKDNDNSSFTDTMEWEKENIDSEDENSGTTIADIMKAKKNTDNVSNWSAFGNNKVVKKSNGIINFSSDKSISKSNQNNSFVSTKPIVSKPSNSNNNQSNTDNPSNNGNQNNNVNNGNQGNTSNNGNQNTTPIVLPNAAFGTETTGDMNQRLVAAYKENDIYMPSISLDNQTATYYTKINDNIYLWNASLASPEKPVSKGAVTGSNFQLKNTTTVYTSNTAIPSPDMSMMAMNAHGDESGIWLSFLTGNEGLIELCKEGGGDLLAWAPNSSKFAFTDAEGKLYIAYPIEKRIVLAFEDGKVKDIAWGNDNKTLIFTATGSENGENGENSENGSAENADCKMSLFTIQIP